MSFLRNGGLGVGTVLSVIAFVLIALLFMGLSMVANTINAVNQNRYDSYLLADELRQSSDDLTRLARTYVVTMDDHYKEQYFAILAIRNGERAKPEGYNRIYWDFALPGARAPRPDSNIRVPLTDLMREEGFTDSEMAKLDEAKRNSDGLVNTEVKAFSLIDEAKKGHPEAQATAIKMMHDTTYHTDKAHIMQPIDEFYVMLDARTHLAVADANKHAFWLKMAFIPVGLLLLLSVYLTFRSLRVLLGGTMLELQQFIGKLASGDFSTVMATSSRNPGSLVALLVAMQSTLADIFKDVHQATQQLRHSAQDISGIATESAHVATNQQGGTEMMASAVEQLVVSINRLSTHAQDAERLGKASSDALATGSEVIDSTLSSIRGISATVGDASSSLTELNTHAQKISDIIEVIRGIAEQTNLLALNAAIEAARAGDQGRGFAVVADEVRNLARRSAQSTEQITEMISKIQAVADVSIGKMQATVNNVTQGVTLAGEAGQAVNDIMKNAGGLLTLIAEMSHALKEQNSVSHEVAQTVNQIAEQAAESRSKAGQTSQEAEKLLSLSAHLGKSLERITL
jgi:methyl-accepting chemotaxis protein